MEKRQHSKPEINSGEILVDTAGYISRERRIKNLLRAGARLQELRQLGAFDVLPGEEEDENMVYPPQRNKGYDLAEASQRTRELKRELGSSPTLKLCTQPPVKSEGVPKDTPPPPKLKSDGIPKENDEIV